MMDDDSINITERYEYFKTTVREVAEGLVNETCDLPSWVSDETTNLSIKRDKPRRNFL